MFWFHLTRYRYLFFAISGAIIVPGLLALMFWHLNLGIDFTNGTTVSLRFQQANAGINSNAVAQVFRANRAEDVNVFLSSDFNKNIKPSQIVYIQFDRPIGPNFRGQVLDLLNDPKAKLPKATELHTDYLLHVGDKQIGMIVVQLDKPAKQSDLAAALKDLPKTDAPPAELAGTGTSGTTASPTTASSPTATPKASATPTTAPASGEQTFPVSLASVDLGQGSQIFQINTQTDLVNTPQAAAKGPRLDRIVEQLQQQFGPVYVVESNTVGPAIAGEQTLMAFLAVAAASLFILIYIAIAFRKVGSVQLSVRFGASAILALLHDAVVVLGLWAIFGHLFNFKIDTLFVTAVLTVIGFSVHDTIVVFDRIRENLGRHTVESFNTVVDTSLIQTMSRSLNTSLTVLLVLSAEVLFGGASTREFVLALLIGIASGTYSSIFNASMILSVWQNAEYKGWFRRGTPAIQPAATRSRPPARVRA